jgi:hypothetical protein
MMGTLKKQIMDAAPNMNSNHKVLFGAIDPRHVSMRLADGLIRWDLPYPKLKLRVLGGRWDAVAGGMIEVASLGRPAKVAQPTYGSRELSLLRTIAGGRRAIPIKMLRDVSILRAPSGRHFPSEMGTPGRVIGMV